MIEQSAGGLILNPEGKILLVENHGTTWGFPKGHLEKGENEEQAALREVQEETGLADVKIEKRFEPYTRQTRKGVEKRITMFLMRTKSTTIVPQEKDVTNWQWATKQEALARITHKMDRHFLEDALCACK